tara:strand:+ start:263 stop:661 length:399 start_codon:yes stop_codon:yes gene_type:complete
MSLEVDIQTAYEAQEAAETTARDLESRIRKIHGAAGLLPPRQYGQPIDRDAIAKSLTLRSLIAREDRHLAAYLGISLDTRKADAEIEAAKMQAERMRLETQRLREKNQSNAQRREWAFGAGINPWTGRRLGQ